MAIQSVKLGKFAQDSSGMLYGRICALGIGSTNVVSQEAKSMDGRPYLKLVADSLNAAYEVGAAFLKEKDGMTYYSVILDSPLFPASLNAALFPDKENEGMFNLVWNKEDAVRYSAEPGALPGSPGGRRYIGAGAAP